MADFDFDNLAFDVDEVDNDYEDNIGDDDLLSTSLVPPASRPAGTETAAIPSLRQELLLAAVDDYYNALADGGLTPALGRDTTKFELVDGQLRLKAYPEIDLVNSRTRKPLKLSTISGRRGGAAAIRDELGFSDWTRKTTSLRAQATAALNGANRDLGEAAAAVDTVELQELGQVATDASNAVHELETTLTNEDIDEILGTMDDPPLNLRELRGLDKTLQTIRGELTNNLAKLSELDDHIKLEERKLAEADSGGVDEVIKRLRDLQDERASRLEAAATNRDALRSQVNRMRETIQRVLHEDTTLAERIRTLFREQGVTIASILTALGMAVSTLVLALTGSGGGGATPTPSPQPSDKAGIKEWVKKHLQSLGRALAKLAGKAAAALPGIIGSVVSWVLSLLAKTVGWLAQNMWAVVLTVGSLLLIAAREWLAP
jgi:hypothetical protein